MAVGGAIGAVARLLVFHAVHGRGRAHGPWTTMGINLAGCLVLGLLLGWLAAREGAGKPVLDERLRAFLTVGVLGGFTTFSTYAGDAMKLLQERRPGAAMLYLLGSAVLGVAVCMGGYSVSIRSL